MSADSATVPTSVSLCTYCRRPFAADDDQVVHYADGAIAGIYHDWCRPDRRRSGCTGSACKPNS